MKLRLYATIFMLGVGAGMAALYLIPEQPAAPNRINTDALKAVRAAPSSAPHAAAEKQPVEPPSVVVVPDQPLLRAATSAPPIDTTLPAVGLQTVHHDAPIAAGAAAVDPTSVRIESPAPASDAATAAGTAAATITRKHAYRKPARRASPAPQRSARNADTKRVESLFLNPLGVR
jgi:hypothetical protein